MLFSTAKTNAAIAEDFRDPSSFLAFFLGLCDQSMITKQHIDELLCEDDSLQIKYGSFGRAVCHRYKGINVEGTEKMYVPDMRFSDLPTRLDARPGFETTFEEVEKLVNDIDKGIRLVSLADSTAKGKTALIFRLAMYQFVIYIVGNPDDKERDEDHAFLQLVNKIEEESKNEARNFTQDDALSLVKLDLLSRLALMYSYFSLCLQENIDASPKNFLLLQLNGGNDFVQHAFEAATLHTIPKRRFVDGGTKLLIKTIFTQLKTLQVRDANKFPFRIGLAIDEAQESAIRFSEYSAESFSFLNRNRNASANLLCAYASAVVLDMPKKCPLVPLILSGTGYTRETLKSAGSGANKLSTLGEAPALPFLTSDDIIGRWRAAGVNLDRVNLANSFFLQDLSKLEGRPRTSASVIESYLPYIVDMYPTLDPTQQLRKAMDLAFNDMVKHLTKKVSKILSSAYRNNFRELLQRMFTILSIAESGDCLKIEECCSEDDIDELIKAGLCFRINRDGLDSISYSEPAFREVILAVGRDASPRWIPSDILHSMIIRSANDGTGKNYELFCDE